MASIKYCDKCNGECYWEKDALTERWVLIDSETEKPHWETCLMRNMQRGQHCNPVLKKPAVNDAVMDFVLALEQRVKKLEDKINGPR